MVQPGVGQRGEPPAPGAAGSGQQRGFLASVPSRGTGSQRNMSSPTDPTSVLMRASCCFSAHLQRLPRSHPAPTHPPARPPGQQPGRGAEGSQHAGVAQQRRLRLHAPVQLLGELQLHLRRPRPPAAAAPAAAPGAGCERPAAVAVAGTFRLQRLRPRHRVPEEEQAACGAGTEGAGGCGGQGASVRGGRG